MAPTRSDASAAAASAVTRSGRVKRVSKAALRAVASENHEAQQARRSGVNNKSVRRAGTNQRGQIVVSGTPKVVVSGLGPPRTLTRRSALAPLNVPIPRQPSISRSTAPPLQITALQNAMSAAMSTTMSATTSTTLVNSKQSDSLDLFHTTATAQPRSQTSTSVVRPSSSVVPETDIEDSDAMDIEPHGRAHHQDSVPADRPGRRENLPAGNGEGTDTDDHDNWHQDDVEDWDEGASDAYVPTDVGDEQDQEQVDDVDGDDIAAAGEHGDDSGDVAEDEVDGKGKSRARRNSKKMKKGQPKASDYSEDVEALLNHGLGYMRALVIAEKPMPSVDESIDLSTDAFEMAKRDRPAVRVPSDVKYISILRRAIPQVCGKVKDAARARTGDTYGFDDRPRMEQKNRRRYLALIEQDAYTYEKPDSLQGPYYHPLCYKILKTCFFSKVSDEGVACSEYFTPIRPETIAIIFTAIRMCLDEWKSGSYKPLMFTSDIYEPVYQVHLANLKALEEEDPLFVKGLGEERWEDCSEPFDLENKSKPAVSIAAAQRASGALYGQERRNARAAQKASTAAAAAAAATEIEMELQ